MKNIILFSTVLIVAFFMFSCGSKSKDFDIDEIEEPCDCVDAIYDLANDFFDHIGEQSELESGYTKELKSKIRNIKKLDKECRMEFDRDEFEDCDGFEKFVVTMDVLEDKF